MDRHRERMAEDKGGVMSLGGSLVEYPFGTLKVWAGVGRGLAPRPLLPIVGTERRSGDFDWSNDPDIGQMDQYSVIMKIFPIADYSILSQSQLVE